MFKVLCLVIYRPTETDFNYLIKYEVSFLYKIALYTAKNNSYELLI